VSRLLKCKVVSWDPQSDMCGYGGAVQARTASPHSAVFAIPILIMVDPDDERERLRMSLA
jgi:hypothetical protein